MRGGWIGTLSSMLVALVSGTLWAKPEAIAVDEAPQAWMAYAQRVSQHLQAALDGNAEVARRLIASCTRQMAAHGGATEASAFRVRVWLDRWGRVKRVDTSELTDDAAKSALLAALRDQRVGARPPRGMAQPLVVRLAFGVEP